MMLNSLEKMEDHLWISYLKNTCAVSSVGYSLLQPTPVSLITALALSILVIAQKLTSWASPQSLGQHVVAKLAITLSLALISAVAMTTLFGFSLAGASVTIQAGYIAFPTLFFSGVELLIAYFTNDGKIWITPKDFVSALEKQEDFQGQKVRVTGSLDLTLFTEETEIRSLPENLMVDGDLHFNHCSKLRSLPENLNVKGNLFLSNCVNLISLPESLCAEGDLHLEKCENLTSLSEDLSVGGSLSLRACAKLESLPDNLTVEKDLDLSSCTGLQSLPENFKVKGNLNLSNCTGLQSLPESLEVKGTLNLKSCTGLQSLPNKLKVERHMILDDCTDLKSLPESLIVEGHISLVNCIRLTSLPNWMFTRPRIDGEVRTIYLDQELADAEIKRIRGADSKLVYFDCPDACVREPDGDIPEMELGPIRFVNHLKRHNGFVHQKKVKVKGSLSLYHEDFVPKLRFPKPLPETLTVEGDLHLTGLPNEIVLPEELRVQGDLHLTDLSITSLPKQLTVGKQKVYVKNCPDLNLTDLPNEIEVVHVSAELSEGN